MERNGKVLIVCSFVCCLFLQVGRHLTAADFQIVFPIEAAASRASEIVGPRTSEYLARIHARAAYQRGLEKGGPYAYAKCQ
jgi:glutathione S-transferase